MRKDKIIDRERFNEIVSKGHSPVEYSIDQSLKNIQSEAISSVKNKVRIYSDSVSSRIRYISVFAIAIQNGNIKEINQNAKMRDSSTVSLDFISNNTTQNNNDATDSMKIYTLQEFGDKAKLLASHNCNLVLLTTEKNNDQPFSFRKALENDEIDSARNWLELQGIQVNSQNNISTYVVSGRIDVETVAFVINIA